jgi:hypothetical protein
VVAMDEIRKARGYNPIFIPLLANFIFPSNELTTNNIQQYQDHEVLMQANTAIMTNLFSDQNSNSQGNNFLPNLFSREGDKLNNLYSDYPLNLLPEMDTLLSVILMFLFIILNIFIVRKLINMNYNKYIPNNKAGKILSLVISRYISIWSKASNFMLIYSWLMIFIFTIVLKFGMYAILNYN